MCVIVTASSKSKKAKWRKWADQKLEPKKSAAASTTDVSATAAEPDPAQLPIAEVAQPQPLSATPDAASSKSSRKVEATGNDVSPFVLSDIAQARLIIHLHVPHVLACLPTKSLKSAALCFFWANDSIEALHVRQCNPSESGGRLYSALQGLWQNAMR